MNRKLLALAPSALLLFGGCSTSGDEGGHRADLATVVRDSFDISVIESGEILAANSTRVKNEMEGNSTIIFLIDEGSIVEKGDLLVELDASSQIERRATQEIAVEKAKAAVVNARKSLEILRKQVDSDILAAKNTWLFAQMDKKKFYGEQLPNGEREMGEQEQSIKAEEAEISLARSELKLAEDRYKWSMKLREKEFITQDDLDRDRLDYESKKTRLTLAINKLAILKKYTHDKTRRELDQAEEVARIEHLRTVAKGEAEIAQAVADLNAKVKEDELATERLVNLEKQIESARVRAPTPGIVVYASEGDRWRRRTIEIGSEVRERQSLIVLPDTTHMYAELKIQEVMIDKIRPGLPALIKIDAREVPFTGRVLRRAPLPDSGSRGMNPDLKVYKTTIDIDGRNEDQLLNPNMSATVEIVVARLEDVLSVPQAAVFSQGAVQYVWLRTPAGPVATRVTIGPHNESRVVIEQGLEAGQQVFLVEPGGEKAPEFEQPAQVEIAAPRSLDAAVTGTGRGRRGPAGATGSRGATSSRGPGGSSAAFAALRKLGEDFKNKVKARDAALHAQIEDAGVSWFRNESIMAAIEADPELSTDFASYQSAMQQMRRGRGNRGNREGDPRGEGRPGRGRAGGDGTDSGDGGGDGGRRGRGRGRGEPGGNGGADGGARPARGATAGDGADDGAGAGAGASAAPTVPGGKG